MGYLALREMEDGVIGHGRTMMLDKVQAAPCRRGRTTRRVQQVGRRSKVLAPHPQVVDPGRRQLTEGVGGLETNPATLYDIPSSMTAV